jgi:ribosomal protein S18 acetylase RimI-like enzyme
MNKDNVCAFNIRVDGGDTVVIANDNTTIGYATFDAQLGEITYIFVHPNFRRQGFGAMLVDFANEATGKILKPSKPISPLGDKFFIKLQH